MKTLIARPGWRWLVRSLEAGVDLVFPASCVGCGRGGTDWCADCDRELIRLQGRLCPGCGRPLPDRRACPACRRAALPLTVRSYARYQGPLVRAVLHLKYRPNRRLACRMAGWLEEICHREKWPVELVVPVPLSLKREKKRGYNQAGLVASALAELLHVPLGAGGLRRVRETRSQVGLDLALRAENVQGAFQANPDVVQGRAVLLVDDLYTTGSTLSACAGSLKAAGARQVFGVTVGRA